MKLGVSILWRGATVQSSEKIALEVDRIGFDYLWLTEAWGIEALSTAGYLLGKTNRIKIGVGVLNVFSRSAAVIGMACATLDQIAPDRFVLGLGTSGKAVIERWHGLQFSRPMERTREYVDVIRKVARGDQVDYSGEILKDLSGFRLYTRSRNSDQEIYVGAIGKKNLELAGEISDGAILTMYPLSALPRALEIVNGKKKEKRLFVYLPVKIVNTEEEETNARADVARNIGFYVASMGKYYAQNLSALGFAQDVSKILVAYSKGGSRAAAEAVDDNLIQELSIIGSAEQVKEKLMTKIPSGVIPVFTIDPGSLPNEKDWANFQKLSRDLLDSQ